MSDAQHRQAGNIDNPAPAPCLHPRQQSLGGLQRRVQVDPHYVIKRIQIDLTQCLRANQPYVIHQPGKRKAFAEFPEHLGAALAVGQIQRHQRAGKARVIGIAGDAHHGMPGLRQPGCQGATDTFAGTSDEEGTCSHAVLLS